MPKTPPGGQPDPMLREVNRLLAQLDHAGTRPDRHEDAPRHRTPVPRLAKPRVVTTRSTAAATRGDQTAVWARLFLGCVLAAAMTQWPYPHQCDWALLGYLGAVAAVILAGGWIAFASWRLRSGLPHLISLIVVFWGIVLAAEAVLPRVGYAADRASWRCEAAP